MSNIQDNIINNPVTSCINCNTNDDFKDIIKDHLEGVVLEIERRCNKCNYVLDYWSYGHWESLSEQNEKL